MICAERVRQMVRKGYTLDHDLSRYEGGELLDMVIDRCTNVYNSIGAEWSELSHEERIKELAESGALIAAEIDLLLNKKNGIQANSTIGGIWRG